MVPCIIESPMNVTRGKFPSSVTTIGVDRNVCPGFCEALVGWAGIDVLDASEVFRDVAGVAELLTLSMEMEVLCSTGILTKLVSGSGTKHCQTSNKPTEKIPAPTPTFCRIDHCLRASCQPRKLDRNPWWRIGVSIHR